MVQVGATTTSSHGISTELLITQQRTQAMAMAVDQEDVGTNHAVLRAVGHPIEVIAGPVLILAVGWRSNLVVLMEPFCKICNHKE